MKTRTDEPHRRSRCCSSTGSPRARGLFRAKQMLPERSTRPPRRHCGASCVTMGDGALSSWQGGNPGDAGRLAALVEGCGLRARPLRAARGWGYQRISALGTVIVLDAAPPPPPKMASAGCASTLAVEISDGAQRLVVNCGGPGLPSSCARTDRGVAPTAAHSTLVIDAQFDRDPCRRQLGARRQRGGRRPWRR